MGRPCDVRRPYADAQVDLSLSLSLSLCLSVSLSLCLSLSLSLSVSLSVSDRLGCAVRTRLMRHGTETVLAPLNKPRSAPTRLAVTYR